MWDDHRLLAQIANLLYALAAAALVVAVLALVIRLPVFPLREVRVTGASAHTTRAQVDSIVQGQMRGNFFTIDLEATRLAFEKLPWVRRATLRRIWPDRLEVAIEEHVALARWRDTALVSERGEVFEAATDAHLPVFGGPEESAEEMAAQYRAFADLLATVGRQPAQLRLSKRQAWEIVLDDGAVLELGRQDLQARLTRFVTVYRRTVGRLPAKAYRIDLRYPNGFALRQPGLRWGERST